MAHNASDMKELTFSKPAAQDSEKAGSDFTDDPNADSTDEEIVQAKEIQNSVTPLRKLRDAEEWLDKMLGIETIGIDRIPDEDRKPPSIWNMFFFWWALNVHAAVIPLGVLGPTFGLSFRQSVTALIVGTVLGASCTAFTCTLGPKLGLRQVCTSRYSFGFWGAKICSVLNVVIGGGFQVVNLVVVGQVLSAVSDFSLTIEAGIIIIAVLSYLISVFGYRIIHTYEKYSWIAMFILMIVLVAQASPNVHPAAPGELSGLELSGSYLSIIAIAFSNASGWCSTAADYYVHYPSATSFWVPFWLTFWGITIPTVFSEIVGACLGNAVFNVPYGPYKDAYDSHGGQNLGALLREVYHPNGWSKFCLVILTFSVLGNNIAINYSSGLSLQLLGHYFHAVPRFIWSFAFGLVVAILAIAGRSHLSVIVSNFVSLLGYWTVSFTIVLALEDKLFRGKRGYNLKAWDQVRKLPWGIAAVFSLLAGYLAGGVPGMSQTWYVGPIARKFSEFGGDVGIYMSAAITVVCYLPLRSWEWSYFGR